MQAVRKKTIIYNNDAVRLTRCVTIIYNYTDSESYLLSNTQLLIIQRQDIQPECLCQLLTITSLS